MAEMMDSTGAPPKKEDAISAREEITVRLSTLKLALGAMEAVMAPKEMLEPMFRQTMPRAPMMTRLLMVNF